MDAEKIGIILGIINSLAGIVSCIVAIKKKSVKWAVVFIICIMLGFIIGFISARRYFNVNKEEPHIVAIDPGDVGCEIDEAAASEVEEIGKGATKTVARYSNGGTGKITGVKEYDINLGVGKKLKEELVNRGYKVVMLREDNETLTGSKQRAEMASAAGADICVRIFCRKDQSLRKNGAMVYVPSENNVYIDRSEDERIVEKSQQLGLYILNQYCLKTSFNNSGIAEKDDVVGINWSEMPVAQILLGCINDPSDEVKLADRNNWEAMAEGIADGIDMYFENE